MTSPRQLLHGTPFAEVCKTLQDSAEISAKVGTGMDDLLEKLETAHTELVNAFH